MTTTLAESREYVRRMLETHRPMCGHPACNEEAFRAAIIQFESDEHMMFTCRDMGHWIGDETEVRWVLK